MNTQWNIRTRVYRKRDGKGLNNFRNATIIVAIKSHSKRRRQRPNGRRLRPRITKTSSSAMENVDFFWWCAKWNLWHWPICSTTVLIKKKDENHPNGRSIHPTAVLQVSKKMNEYSLHVIDVGIDYTIRTNMMLMNFGGGIFYMQTVFKMRFSM